MTAAEVYELTTRGGSTDFARVVASCEAFGPYCLIGGLAVNCYVEPVYTVDADIVLIAENLSGLTAHLGTLNFEIDTDPHSINAQPPGSDLRIQFTTDARYQAFLTRAVKAEVLGIPVQVACLEDVTQGKLWAYADRRLSKRKKDELDLIRLAEAYPRLRDRYPKELVDMMESG